MAVSSDAGIVASAVVLAPEYEAVIILTNISQDVTSVTIVLSAVVLTLFPSSLIALRLLEKRSDKAFSPMIGAAIVTGTVGLNVGLNWNEKVLSDFLRFIVSPDSGKLLLSLSFYVAALWIFTSIAIAGKIVSNDVE